MDREMVIVIDFGGQYNQLVARRVRECNVYCEIYSYKTDIEKIKAMNPKGIILTGGPNSCYEPGAPSCTDELFNLGIPVLGLCYGAQLMMHVLGGKVEKAPVREYGKTEVMVETSSPLFTDVTPNTICWMSHFDYISKVAPGFDICAHTADCPVAAAENRDKNLYAIQFHPEVLHTQEGTKMLSNFVRGVCGCSGDWKMDAFVENTIKEIRAKVGNGKVLLALSGGVDSSVAAGLLSRAIGKQLTCVFVDHGLLRKNEGDEVEQVFGPNGQFDLNFIRVNAQERYYSKLAGVTEPERKRKIIGEEFIRVFEEEAKKDGLYAKSINGDAFSLEIKQQVIDTIKADMGKVDMVIYSLAAPRRVTPDGHKYTSVLKTVGEEYTNKTLVLKDNTVTMAHIPAATEEEIENTIKVMGGEDWIDWMQALSDAGVLADHVTTVAYSYIGPKITFPIYAEGSIGMAKKDLYKSSDIINEKFANVSSYIAINKALVTQSSAAIPVVPLYITLLYKQMKAKGVHEGCIEQMARLFLDKMAGEVETDENGLVRMDDWEMADDIQEAVAKNWDAVTSENVKELADIDGYWDEFYKMFGFKIDGVDYSADVDIM